ncbi:hypothetical protein [Macrococcus animalis]|uniref:hypothetical protein n=1 Tax=Macrococcus animalis TaxID=3395467 RepID=UPI0039BEC27D
MKHIELDDRIVAQIFNKFIKKVSPFGIAYLGINQINRIAHKRYDITFKHNDNYYDQDEEEALEVYDYYFVKNIIASFPNKRLLMLCYHTESFEVQYAPDLFIDLPPYPNSDDVLYYIDDNHMIWIPRFGLSIFVIGDKLIEAVNRFCEKQYERNHVITISEHKSRKYFKDKDMESRGPVVDIIMKANDAIIEHLEIYEDDFASIDSLVRNQHNNYAIYGETVLDQRKITYILRDIRNKQYDKKYEPIVKEFESILKMYNMTTLIIGGV